MKSLTRNRRLTLLLDATVLLIAMAYITLGAAEVPFHGDESTTIWMSADYETVILHGDFEAVAYEPPPQRTTEQHLRIITGNLSKIVMGLSWHAIGLTADDLNDQWVWGADRAWNIQNGHVPSDNLLTVTRLSSAWMMAFGAVFVLAAARIVAQHVFIYQWAVVVAGWGAVGFYAVQPGLLVNGRRAMFEGSLMFGLAVIGWLVIHLAARPRLNGKQIISLGLLTGIALGTKHSAAFTVTVLYAGLGLLAARTWYRDRDRRQLTQRIVGIVVATFIALVTFLALHPHWWQEPLDMPKIAIDERQGVLDGQVGFYGGYDSIGDRLNGLWQQMVPVEPQYYEWPDWGTYAGVSEEIAFYEDDYWAGLTNSTFAYVLRYASLAAGIAMLAYSLVYGNGSEWRLVFMSAWWLAGLVIVTLATVPLAWQRYYIPLQIPLMIVMGLGLGTVIELIFRRLARQTGELLAPA